MGNNRKGSISHHRRKWKKTKQQDKQMGESTGNITVTHGNIKTIPVPVYIDMIKRESGIDDINEDNLWHHLQKNIFDCISAAEEDIPPILKEIFAKFKEDFSKMQIGNGAHKVDKQPEVIDLGIDDGPAEVGKLEEKKEGL